MNSISKKTAWDVILSILTGFTGGAAIYLATWNLTWPALLTGITILILPLLFICFLIARVRDNAGSKLGKGSCKGTKLINETKLKTKFSFVKWLKDYGTPAGTILLFLATAFLVYSNYQSIEFQKETLAPQLDIRQLDMPNIPHFDNSNLLVRDASGWSDYISICFRNFGRMDTGAINLNGIFRQQWNSTPGFDIGSAQLENLHFGESSCTVIGIANQGKQPRNDPMNASLVPTGYFEIPVNVTCLNCNEYMRTFILKFCVEPTDKC